VADSADLTIAPDAIRAGEAAGGPERHRSSGRARTAPRWGPGAARGHL